jgi:hypothetical protein
MKLLSHEHKDLMLALKKAGADDHFHFVKKKGWVTIPKPGATEKLFSFHRKKGLELIDGKFETKLSYLVKSKGQTEEFTAWPEVYHKFCAWLSE